MHRAPPYDESADLAELAHTPMIVVCSGAKAILDLRATAERLDTLGVPVLGYRTAELPAFYGAESGIPVPRVDDVQEIVAVFQSAARTRQALRTARRSTAAGAVRVAAHRWSSVQ